MLLDPGHGPRNQNRARIMEGETTEKAEPMLKEEEAKVDTKFLEEIRGMEKLRPSS